MISFQTSHLHTTFSNSILSDYFQSLQIFTLNLFFITKFYLKFPSQFSYLSIWNVIRSVESCNKSQYLFRTLKLYVFFFIRQQTYKLFNPHWKSEKLSAAFGLFLSLELPHTSAVKINLRNLFAYKLIDNNFYVKKRASCIATIWLYCSESILFTLGRLHPAFVCYIVTSVLNTFFVYIFPVCSLFHSVSHVIEPAARSALQPYYWPVM
jgi:hypothetical protein